MNSKDKIKGDENKFARGLEFTKNMEGKCTHVQKRRKGRIQVQGQRQKRHRHERKVQSGGHWLAKGGYVFP